MESSELSCAWLKPAIDLKRSHACAHVHTRTQTHPLTGCTGITAVGIGDGALRGTPGGKETATGLGNTVDNEGSNEGLLCQPNKVSTQPLDILRYPLFSLGQIQHH